MKNIIIGLTALALTFLVSFAVFASGDVALADTKTEICKGISATGADCGKPKDTEKKANDLVADIINIFSWIVGVLAVIFVIFGGFRYITSGGDSSKIGSAKNTIIFALIGLVIVALAQVIVIFVLDTVTN